MVETGRSPTHGKTRREKVPGGFARATCFDWRFTLCLCEKYHTAAGNEKFRRPRRWKVSGSGLGRCQLERTIVNRLSAEKMGKKLAFRTNGQNFLASRTQYSRKDAKKLIWQGRVLHNGKKALSPDVKIDLDTDTLELGTQRTFCSSRARFYTFMLNKPSGVLSAARDPKQPTVLDLVPETYRRSGLFPAGRLDKDTEGFVLITDDGEFAHSILSPKHHVPKTYHARIDGPLTEQMVEEFAGRRCIGGWGYLVILHSYQCWKMENSRFVR